MSGRYRSLSVSITCLVCGLVVVVLTLGSSGPTAAGRDKSAGSPQSLEAARPAWTTIDFTSVGDMDPVGSQGLANFAWLWHGAVDSDMGGCCWFANEPSPDTVAMLWDTPVTTGDTRVSFSEPVEAVFFSYALDTTFGNLAVVAYDDSGVQVAGAPLDVCGAISCGNSCSGDPNGDLCEFHTIELIAQPSRGISYIEFEGPSDAFELLAVDDLTYFEIHPIFLDGFETHDTTRWFEAVGLPPPCAEIELDLSFNFAGFPFTCRVVRTVASTSPTMTPTATTP